MKPLFQQHHEFCSLGSQPCNCHVALLERMRAALGRSLTFVANFPEAYMDASDLQEATNLRNDIQALIGE